MDFLSQESIDLTITFQFAPITLIAIAALFLLLVLVPGSEVRQSIREIKVVAATLLYIRIISRIPLFLRPKSPILGWLLHWYRNSAIDYFFILEGLLCWICIRKYSRLQWRPRLQVIIAIGCGLFLVKTLRDEVPTLLTDTGKHICYPVFPSRTYARTFRILNLGLLDGGWTIPLVGIVLLRFHEHYFGQLEDVLEWLLPRRPAAGNERRHFQTQTTPPRPVVSVTDTPRAQVQMVPHIAVGQIPPAISHDRGPPPPYMPRNLRRVGEGSTNNAAT